MDFGKLQDFVVMAGVLKEKGIPIDDFVEFMKKETVRRHREGLLPPTEEDSIRRKKVAKKLKCPDCGGQCRIIDGDDNDAEIICENCKASTYYSVPPEKVIMKLGAW